MFWACRHGCRAPGRIFAGGDLRRMKRIADQAIDARASQPRGTGQDLLDLLLEAQDPQTGRSMTHEELRDNLLTFIVAGHETTALTLAWALYLCAFDPEVQERAAAEAHSVLGGRAARADDLPALPYVQQIVNEALRLYPPAAFLSRTAMAPDSLCGREVRPVTRSSCPSMRCTVIICCGKIPMPLIPSAF